MARLSLYIDVSSNNLITGLNSAQFVQPSSLPFFVGDTLQMQVYLMTPIQALIPSVFPYSIIPTEGLTLELFITNGLDSSAPGYIAYTQQLVWTPDPTTGDFWTANLALNTAPLITLIGASTSQSAFLVVGYTQGGADTTVLYRPITIQPGLPNSTVVVPPGLTPLSAEAAKSMFVPINGGQNGQGFFILSPNGHRLYVQAQDNPDGSGPATLLVSPM